MHAYAKFILIFVQMCIVYTDCMFLTFKNKIIYFIYSCDIVTPSLLMASSSTSQKLPQRDKNIARQFTH